MTRSFTGNCPLLSMLIFPLPSVLLPRLLTGSVIYGCLCRGFSALRDCLIKLGPILRTVFRRISTFVEISSSLTKWSLQNLAHATIAVISRYVKWFVAIIDKQLKSEQKSLVKWDLTQQGAARQWFVSSAWSNMEPWINPHTRQDEWSNQDLLSGTLRIVKAINLSCDPVPNMDSLP